MDGECEICGNEKHPGSLRCRYCGTKHESVGAGRKTGLSQRVINLEIGRPTAEEAMRKLDLELARACSEGVDILTIIHGYGSSGKGGKIKRECRKFLHYRKSEGALREVIPGEDFTRKSGPCRALLRRFPQLTRNENLGKSNRGVTLVEL